MSALIKVRKLNSRPTHLGNLLRRTKQQVSAHPRFNAITDADLVEGYAEVTKGVYVSRLCEDQNGGESGGA
jgi:hypothetical protein